MKNIIVYPVPFDNWGEFAPAVERFALSFREHPPGTDYELWAMCCWGEPNDRVRSMFYGTKVKFLPHYAGCEALSTHLAAARSIEEGFMLCLTTRCYFHRSGWLKRYVDARAKHGVGMYGGSASMEEYPHICTRAYALDVGILGRWPGEVNRREDSPIMERGPRSLTAFCKANGWATCQVLWDSEQTNWREWRTPDNIFRRGNQEQMLVWDRHTEVYRDADAEEKKKLEALTDGA